MPTTKHRVTVDRWVLFVKWPGTAWREVSQFDDKAEATQEAVFRRTLVTSAQWRVEKRRYRG